MVKISTPTVSIGELVLSKIATGMSTTAATIQTSPILSSLPIKQFTHKTTIIHSKTVTLHPLIFGDT